MTDRLTELVIGLQRLEENARLRGDDLKYVQRQEDSEHLRYLDQLLAEVQRLHSSLIDQRRKFIPVDHVPPEQLNKAPEPPTPKFLQQGPRKVAE